jgi:hypothetical protein
MMHMCAKCGKIFTVIVLILGVLFLLQDLAVWNFWNISWYTVLFLLIGASHVGALNCKECLAVAKKK